MKKKCKNCVKYKDFINSGACSLDGTILHDSEKRYCDDFEPKEEKEQSLEDRIKELENRIKDLEKSSHYHYDIKEPNINPLYPNPLPYPFVTYYTSGTSKKEGVK